jgi:hypothetical protein
MIEPRKQRRWGCPSNDFHLELVIVETCEALIGSMTFDW